MHPTNPFCLKSHFPHNIQEIRLIHPIKSLANVNLEGHFTNFFSSFAFRVMDYFKSHKDIVKNRSSLYKGRLLMGNAFVEHRFEMIG